MSRQFSVRGRADGLDPYWDAYRYFGLPASEFPVCDFAAVLGKGPDDAGGIVVRNGWAITSGECWLRGGCHIVDATDGDAGQGATPLQVFDGMELACRFGLQVLRVPPHSRRSVGSSLRAAQAMGLKLISVQLGYCTQVLELLHDYCSTRQVGGGALSKIPTVRHQFGDAQRQLRFLQEWLREAQTGAGEPAPLAAELASFSAALAKLGGGRSFLSNGLCEAAAMFAVLVNLYPGHDHE